MSFVAIIALLLICNTYELPGWLTLPCDQSYKILLRQKSKMSNIRNIEIVATEKVIQVSRRKQAKIQNKVGALKSSCFTPEESLRFRHFLFR